MGVGEVRAEQAKDSAKAKRVGMVIGLDPNQIEEYKDLHADDHAGVRDLLAQANMRNFSIFLRELDNGDHYLFGYYEYVGDDFDKDMAWLADQPRNKAWLKVTDAMQRPLQGADGWSEMEQVYYNE